MKRELCEHLRPFLDAELAAGNAVAWTDRSIGNPDRPLVMLARPFLTGAAEAPTAPVVREAVNDPHWWGVELRCGAHADQLVCPVG